MRILTGKYKGRLLAMPKGIRPTQDKVRKAIFDILGDIEGLSFLELFAGSGAVGFEALSRGAASLVLVEYYHLCQAAIRKNIASLGCDCCNLYPADAQRAVAVMHKNGKSFDIIFLDPPYYRRLSRKDGSAGLSEGGAVKKTLQSLSAYDILARNGFIIAQHGKRDALPPEVGNLRLIKESRYGDTLLSFYKKVA